jgi:hypothetical protein
MKSRRYPPAYFRYFKARLWNLTRPCIWGTAIFLSVVGLAIKEYWANPAVFTNRQSKPVATQQEPNPTLSPEDRANVADIDNLPVLVYDSKLGLPPALEAAESTAKLNQQAKTPLEEALSKQQTASDTKLNVADNSVPSPKFNNPFLTQAENLLQLGNIQRNNRFVGLNAFKPSSDRSSDGDLSSGLQIGLTKKNNTDKAVPVNPLEAAFNASSTSQDLPKLNGSSSLNPLQPSLNQSFNLNQTNQNSNPANSNPNTTNNFGLLQPTNTLPQSTSQPNTSRTGLTQEGINALTPALKAPTGSQFGSIPNSTGLQPNITNQPQIYNNGSITQPQIYNGNYNNGNLNNNLNNNNLNNNQSLPNTTQSIPITPVTLPVPNYTTPYSLNLNRTNVPSNTQINNGALINQGSQQTPQVQQYNPSSPNLLPTQYPTAGQGIRY